MASSSVLKLASLLLVVCMAVTTVPKAADAAITCGGVVNHLMPCISYVQNGGQPTAACCNGVRALYAEAQTSTDRQSVCKCLKSAINGFRYSSFNLGNAAGLPDKCSLHIPYKISPSIDCNTVQ
ncbi:non-specific lipid-transfer protein 3-like [Hibiscus syriacus]|uniref:non-specific lipid-transfer protein 3-like n=1 Tax=Hibiscus syriacus TaxID=106335 RepID=UPI001921A909|nr:non-specific lipid-transfer protein 3-like [Hibiscus syriacus]